MINVFPPEVNKIIYSHKKDLEKYFFNPYVKYDKYNKLIPHPVSKLINTSKLMDYYDEDLAQTVSCKAVIKACCEKDDICEATIYSYIVRNWRRYYDGLEESEEEIENYKDVVKVLNILKCVIRSGEYKLTNLTTKLVRECQNKYLDKILVVMRYMDEIIEDDIRTGRRFE